MFKTRSSMKKHLLGYQVNNELIERMLLGVNDDHIY